MNQRRPIRNVIVWVSAILLLGAVVNFGVTIAFALLRHERPADAILSSAQSHELHVRMSSLGLTPGFDDRDHRFVLEAEVTQSLGRQNFQLMRHELNQSTGTAPLVSNRYAMTQAEEMQVGWPLACAHGMRTRMMNAYDGTPLTKFTYASAVAIPDDWFKEYLPGDRWLPLRPIRSGIYVNTLAYGATLWLLLAMARQLRRRWRLKRGLCPACKYPIGTSEVCTECGRRLARTCRQSDVSLVRQSRITRRLARS